MRRILIVFGVLAFSTSAFAQMPMPAAPAASALPWAGLPANIAEGAGLVAWKSDFTYDTMAESTNGLVCYDLTGRTGQRPFSVECTSMANLPRKAQSLKFEADGGGDRDKTRALVAAAEENGTRVEPAYGSVWYNFTGDSEASANLHITIATPGATTASTGLPDSRQTDSVWLMGAGTSTAHIMIPGR